MREREPDHFRVQGPSAPPRRSLRVPLFELSSEQSRQLDRLAVERYGIPSIVLMENACIGLRIHAMKLLSGINTPSVLICCGPGNNGGDGFALARHLHNEGVEVRVICTHPTDQYTGDAATNLETVKRMGISISLADGLPDAARSQAGLLIVDALLGTGLSRPIEGAAAGVVDWINTMRQKHGTRVLSVDLPSGLDADTGEALGGRAVRADVTVTMAALKPCMARVEAHDYLGSVSVVPIGVPIELLRELGTPIVAKHRD